MDPAECPVAHPSRWTGRILPANPEFRPELEAPAPRRPRDPEAQPDPAVRAALSRRWWALVAVTVLIITWVIVLDHREWLAPAPLVVGAISALLWRCPRCGASLGRDMPEHCPGCAVRLREAS